MRTPRIPDPRVCSIDAALKVIGEKWALLALRELLFGATKFDEIVFNTGAPRDVLATRLRSLEEAGVVDKDQYQEKPVRYAYRLTESGRKLFDLLHVIRDWGDQHVRVDPENVVTFHHSCGAKFTPEMHCAACGKAVEPGSITSERDVHRSDIAIG
ncbi:helix-turn-helix domain-containing protein [Mycobacterium sp. AZCC_0083]|uniref:winged helix-turn-helix transcriptional regulator n=1 Tax=Mycobacterium sp. AZCC_0083 TaxID=2735882 RepID=UPI001610E2E1|nr:helix-turn-helix domain-containing protein [Mycobacterium sp. AZCC_0083]MBB5167602.1 DNA-binding HxlR family transcriptional regulator [Mycobacterium sp. AZCC_0083]